MAIGRTAKITILLVLLGAWQGKGQSWEWLNPMPTNRDLRAVVFVNSATGWVAGEAGAIIKTSDGGQNWFFQESGLRRPIRKIDAINETTIYAAADAVSAPGNPTILKTADGGETWMTLDSPAREDGYTYSLIDFVTSDFGWVLGDSAYFTLDGGLTWEGQAWPEEVNSAIEPVAFGTETLHCVRLNRYLRTTDRGLTWNVTELDSGFRASQLYFSDENHGWTSGIFPGPDPIETRTYRTTDGGESWQIWSTELFTYLVNITFADSEHGWAIASGPEVTSTVRTFDGGSSWLATGELPEHEGFWDWYFADAQTGAFVTDSGKIYGTIDGAESWQEASYGFHDDIIGVSFIDREWGWIATDNGSVLATVNGGRNWSQVTMPVEDHYLDIKLIGQTGVLTSYESGILYSGDTGNTWLQSFPDVPDSIYFDDVFLLDESAGIVTSGWGYYLVTANGGADWELRNIGFDPHQGEDFYSVLSAPFFLNEQEGWMIGTWYEYFSLNRDFRILHTSDGETWSDQFASPTVDLRNICFVDAEHGWAVGREGFEGILLSTGNGGDSWNELWRSSRYRILSDVLFVNEDKGWIAAVDSFNVGVILHTVDGGATWEEESIPRTNSLTRIAAADTSVLFATGNDGAVLRLDRHSGAVGADSPVPDDFGMQLTAYPNPFNNAVTISFYLPKSTHSRLAVFDITGRLAAELQNGLLASGWHQAYFENSSLASGVYIARLETEWNSMATKLSLIR